MASCYTPFSRLCTFVILALTFFMSACDDKVESTHVYTVYEPVYTSPAEIRASFAVGDPAVLKEPGKIYMYGNYLFINEPGEGIHVINNADKTNPVNIKFINLPGNYDFAAKDGVLYADSYMDLVVLDISDINNIKISSRTENIFANVLNSMVYNSEKGIITDWIEREKIEVTSGDINDSFPGFFPYRERFFATSDFALMSQAMSPSFTPAPSSVGVGGSMARFTIADHYLYTIDQSSLYVFNIQNPEKITQGPTVNVGWGIETVFPSNGNLFIGAQNGLYIYSLADPLVPRRLSLFAHVVSCDPVVVNDTLAYVTLRGGSGCRGGFTNQLDIINIQNLEAPQLLISHPMSGPYGLGYDKGLLFICEGEQGLKVFDVTDIWEMDKRLLVHNTTIDAYDVIPYQDVLILIGRDGLYQFDYSTPTDLKLLSQLTIERKIPVN